MQDMKPEVTKEEIHAFLNGHRSIDRIVKIEGDYNDRQMTVFFRDEKGRKHPRKEDFYPFLWCKQSAARQFFIKEPNPRRKLKDMMDDYGIGCKGLRVHDTEGNIHPRMENGYRVLFFAKIPMTYARFMEFFEKAGRPVYPKQGDANYGERDYVVVAPVEQFMISTGYRMFKGYSDYNELRRLIFDLETEGLEATRHRISKIGIRTNNGFEKIIQIDGEGLQKNANELVGVKDFFNIIKEEDPDIITGYNSENFDFPFIDTALVERHLTNLEQLSIKEIGGRGMYKRKKQQVLKLGGEMEYYFPTIFYGHNVTDGLFAVRRAQAIDSNMKKADLKYVTKYSKINKPNRVYIPGKIINTTDVDTSKSYAFNDENGHWLKVTDDILNKTYTVHEGGIDLEYRRYELSDDKETLVDKKNGEKFQMVTGRYIVDRYLLDDLWETDKIEHRYNLPNFLVGKMLPVQFDKMCTMGTAAIWKYIMLAWSYEHDLAVPELIESKQFTGGLSRLLKVGYVDRIVKLDYNSLYPSILLTFNIKSPIDVMGVMLAILEYILTQREHYKELKGEYGGKAKKIKKAIDNCQYSSEEEKLAMTKQMQDYERESSLNDKLQLPLKITGNGFFGSFGAGMLFPWSDLICAEETTCTGRMMLRLMISHFTKLGYTPIVGDSFTADTPLFIKYDDTNLIDIKPVSELIYDSEIRVDGLGREYDCSEKRYKVLCRSGWVTPTYIYRHKTDKNIYEITQNEMRVEVTEDHSLFNTEKKKISPTELTDSSELEYFEHQDLYSDFNTETNAEIYDDAWLFLLNADIKIKSAFLSKFDRCNIINKTTIAKLQFIENCVRYSCQQMEQK